MKILKYIFWVIILGVVVGTYYYILTSPISKNKSHLFNKIHSGTYIVFYNIDNAVNLYVNDSLAFESGVIYGNPNLDLEFGLLRFLKKGKNLIKIELLNGDCDNCEPTPWEIRYELIQNEEVLEFVYESSQGQGEEGGLKFEKNHEVFYTPQE
ncbi:hypothetical protein [Reichenbachiella sp. MALMAid0571]|uniref:hypothetical protein n=1 Tax=Reichenbachiella sp. MALMAid0571 TaxID=3143939 RepID=UPI0032DFD036